MSIKVVVYVPALATYFISRIAERFAELGMECQFHPGFALIDSSDPTQVQLQLRVLDSSLQQYQQEHILSNFELSFKDFRYSAPVTVNPATNEKLKSCTKQAIIKIHATHTSAYRAGMYFAALLAEVSNGVLYVPRADSYMEPAQAIEHVVTEVRCYENELPPEDWHVVHFTGW